MKTSTIELQAPQFVTPYTLPKGWSKRSSMTFLDPSLTVQADRESSDINFIVKQFGLTRKLPYGVDVPEYADYSDIPNDFHQAMQYLEDSNAAFLEMPAPVRARFDNDPGLFLDFVRSPDNYDEAVSLGLVLSKDPTSEPDSLAPTPA